VFTPPHHGVCVLILFPCCSGRRRPASTMDPSVLLYSFFLPSPSFSTFPSPCFTGLSPLYHSCYYTPSFISRPFVPSCPCSPLPSTGISPLSYTLLTTLHPSYLVPSYLLALVTSLHVAMSVCPCVRIHMCMNVRLCVYDCMYV
jgi:hypothetical protein